jgi:hypothetical protein
MAADGRFLLMKDQSLPLDEFLVPTCIVPERILPPLGLSQ